MEDQILMLYSSQSFFSLLFKFRHVFHALLVYTLIAVIILSYPLAIDIKDSTGTVIYALTTSGLGPKLAINDIGSWCNESAPCACHLAYLATQRNDTGIVTACHVTTAPAYKAIASSAAPARTVTAGRAGTAASPHTMRAPK